MQKSSSSTLLLSYLANIYLFQVSNRNTRKRCEIWLDLTKKTPERRVFIVNFEHNSHFFLLLSLNMQMLPSFTAFQWLLWFRWTLSNICCMVICGESSFFQEYDGIHMTELTMAVFIAGKHLKVNNKTITLACWIFLNKLLIETSHQDINWHRSGVFNVNFEHILKIVSWFCA